MYTEDEAREKWCPFARIIQVVPAVAENKGRERGLAGFITSEASYNRVSMATDWDEDGLSVTRKQMTPCRCIASECMSWRWAKELTAEQVAKVDYEGRGYCGLAGKPDV